MESYQKNIIVPFIVALFLVLSSLSFASADEYDAMKGVESVKVMFDMRDGIPASAAVHLKLIHSTYQELSAMKKEPVFAVVFMGGAVKLVSGNRVAFSSEDQKYLTEIADTISQMSKTGVRLEVCLFAAKFLGVDPASIHPDIKHVGNGWISEIGYQAKGYQLVPVY